MLEKIELLVRRAAETAFARHRDRFELNMLADSIRTEAIRMRKEEK